MRTEVILLMLSLIGILNATALIILVKAVKLIEKRQRQLLDKQ